MPNGPTVDPFAAGLGPLSPGYVQSLGYQIAPYGTTPDIGEGWNAPLGLPPLPDSYGDGGYVTPFSQTQAGMRLGGQLDWEQLLGQQQGAMEQIRTQGQLAWEKMLGESQRDKELAQMQIDAAKELEVLRQKGALSLEEMRQKFALEQQLKQIAFEREALYVQYKGQDPVRAVMLGMGMLGEGEGGAKYKGLPKIKGAAEYEKKTEKALGGITGRRIDITGEGVLGLPSVEKTATRYQRGGEDVRTLLTSAFGVGGLGGGMSEQETQRRIQEVTPTGTLR